jgi:hypothetical protein
VIDWRWAAPPIAASAPLHGALALGTDLSPDEAYYLSAARLGSHLLVDHPPLTPWLLGVTDAAIPGPVELGVRVWPFFGSLVVALLVVAIAAQRGARGTALGWAALVGSFALLSIAGGFVMTPDTPLLVSLSALLWLAGRPPEASPAREVLADLGWAVCCAAMCLSKVIALPVVGVVTALSPGSHRRKLLGAVASVATLPWWWPSLRFQWDHAYGSDGSAWMLDAAFSAFAEAIGAQVGLWSPWVLAGAAIALWRARAERLARLDGALIAALTGLVIASAWVRAVAPEANWWAPAALLATVWAGRSIARWSAPHRVAVAIWIVAPSLVAASHVLYPWLPIPPERDPTLRLRGWRGPDPPIDAPGVGEYGPAAQACALRDDCDAIESYLLNLNEMD